MRHRDGAAGTGNRNGVGVRAEPLAAAAPRRHVEAALGVGPEHPDQARGRHRLGVVGEPAHVARAAQRHRRQPVHTAALDGQRGPAPRDDLTEAVVAVEHRDRRCVDGELDLGGRVQVPALQGRAVLRHADDAVGVVAAQVGAHEQCRDPLRVVARHVARGEDVGGESLEVGGGNGRHRPLHYATRCRKKRSGGAADDRIGRPAIACRLGGRDHSRRPTGRRHRARLHPRAGRPVLHAPARRPRRRRPQDRAARGRRHPPRLRPARARARGPGDVLRAHQRRQAQRRAGSHQARGASRRARSRSPERRRRRELRARRGGPPGLRPRHAVGGEAGPRLLLDLGLRSDGAVAGAAGLRAHHQRGVRAHAPRAQRRRRAAGELSAGGRRARRHARLRCHLRRAPAPRTHRSRRAPRRLDAGMPRRRRGHHVRRDAQRGRRIPRAARRHADPPDRGPVVHRAERGRARSLGAAAGRHEASRPRPGSTLRHPAGAAPELGRAAAVHRRLDRHVPVCEGGAGGVRGGADPGGAGADAGGGRRASASRRARVLSRRPASRARGCARDRRAVHGGRAPSDAHRARAVPSR